MRSPPAYDPPVTRSKTLPRVVTFAGPNGAGTSTHADAILAGLGIATFVNADYIARGLSGSDTETVAFEAGRIMLRRLRQLADAGEDFAFESTLSSRTFAGFLRDLKARGYHGKAVTIKVPKAWQKLQTLAIAP